MHLIFIVFSTKPAEKDGKSLDNNKKVTLQGGDCY